MSLLPRSSTEEILAPLSEPGEAECQARGWGYLSDISPNWAGKRPVDLGSAHGPQGCCSPFTPSLFQHHSSPPPLHFLTSSQSLEAIVHYCHNSVSPLPLLCPPSKALAQAAPPSTQTQAAEHGKRKIRHRESGVHCISVSTHL